MAILGKAGWTSLGRLLSQVATSGLGFELRTFTWKPQNPVLTAFRTKLGGEPFLPFQ